MNFEILLNSKKIEKVEKEQFEEETSLKDIISAKHSYDSGDYDWSVAIAYNSVLRAARKFMQELGFRPIGKEHHKNALEFLRVAGFNEELIDYFDNIRKLRNEFVYGSIENATKDNAKETILKAEDFVQEIRTFVQEIRTGAKN
jgi:uncharacterized protein (UPF0332 family)